MADDSRGAARYVTPVLIALGVIAAAFLVFQFAAPKGAPPEPAEEAQTAPEMGPGERYGLTPREVASLMPADLAQRALSKSRLDLVEAAAADDELSATVLCAAQFSGTGAPQDDAAAAKSCAHAQAQRSTLGAYVMSVLTREGRGGIPADPRAADALLKQAAETDARAQLDLAERVRPTRPAEARALLEKCAAQGVDDCTFVRARMEQRGEGGKRDSANALSTFQNLTEQNFHPAATREMARMFLTGDGAPKDVERGVLLLKRAEVLEDAEASFLLGQQAEKGEGVPKEEALAHYKLAAERGYAPAQDAVKRLGG